MSTIHDTAFVPVSFQRRGIRHLATTRDPAHDATFIEMLARGFYWQHLLDSGQQKGGAQIAAAEGLHPTTVNELLRLTLLAPEIIEQFIDGDQPRRVTFTSFRQRPVPVLWAAQREMLSRYEETN